MSDVNGSIRSSSTRGHHTRTYIILRNTIYINMRFFFLNYFLIPQPSTTEQPYYAPKYNILTDDTTHCSYYIIVTDMRPTCRRHRFGL